MDILLFISADLSIGRIEKNTLPTQALLELVLKDCPVSYKIYGTKERIPEMSEWRGVLRDPTGSVSAIFWANMRLACSLAFEWLPPSLKELHVLGCFLTGTIDVGVFSQSLTAINLSVNELTGTLVLDDLPRKITAFNVSDNRLSGSLSLENLPDALTELHLDVNMFSGSVCLTSLPRAMTFLKLNENLLSGSVDVTRLPPGMVYLHLGSNQFEGDTNFSKIPESLELFDVSHTYLSGRIYLGRDKKYNANRSQVDLHFY